MATEQTVTETSAAPVAVATATKKPVIAKVSVDETANTLTFEFGHGVSHVVELDKLDESLRHRAMLHGFEQKLRDSYAGAKGSAVEAEGMFLEVLDTLKSGAWNMKVSGEPREEPIELLAKAMVNAFAARGKVIPLAVVLDKIKGVDKKERAVYRKNPEISVELAKLKAAAVVKTASLDDLAGQFA